MVQLRFIGGCVPLFIMAIVFDITGVVLLLVGICGDVRRRGVFYGDFLIHTGALLLFASLGFWLMWYVGNIRVKEERLERRSSAAQSVKNLARKLTERLSKTHDTGEKPAGKSSTIRNVTWGKSSYFPGQKDPETDTIKCDELPKDEQFMCYQNKGYEDEESNVTAGDDTIQDQSTDEKSDVKSSNETCEETKPDEFTCYQNEAYEETESHTTEAGEEQTDGTEAGEEQTESCDTLL